MVATRDAVLGALEAVRDPELDEAITSLGFVASCSVSGDGDVRVRLRLPTYFCAPNFAFLMAADAYDAACGVTGVRSAQVVLEDHFAGDAINNGIAARASFMQTFPGEARQELADLRADFLRKAVMAGTDQVCRLLVSAGATPDELAAITLGDVPSSSALSRLRQRRVELGLSADDQAPLVIEPISGVRVPPSALPLHLRKARTTATGVQANTSICRGMLRHRYATAGLQESEPGEEEPR